MIIWRHLLPWHGVSADTEAVYWSTLLLWWDHTLEVMQ
jgi:hypothetical protein